MNFGIEIGIERAQQSEVDRLQIETFLPWVVVAGLTVVVGLAGSRSLLSRPPLPVLREAPE